MVIGKVKLKPPKKSRSRKGKRYCLENLKNEECSRELKSRVQEKLPDGVNGDVEAEWEEMKTTIKSISEEIVQVKTYGNNKKKTAIWWTEDVKQAVGAKMRYFRKWM